MAGSSVIVRAPWQGEDIVTAPPVVRSDRGTLLRNFLPGRAGKLVLRGPVTQGLAFSPHATKPGLWEYSDELLFVRADGLLQSWNFNAAGVPPSLSGTFSPPLANMRFTRKSVRFGLNIYGIAEDNSGVNTAIYKWAGVHTTVGLAKITNGPLDPVMQDLAVHLSRIFVLGGNPPGGPSNGTRRDLYWTDPLWDGTDTLAKWQDDVSGLVNRITFDEDAHTLESFNGALYALGNTGIRVLRGSSPSNFTVRKVSSIGCLDGRTSRTAITTDEGIYYITDSGINLFDGTASMTISDPICSAFSQLLPGGELSILDATWLVFVPALGDRWYAYHRTLRTWSEFQSALLGTGIPKWLGVTSGETIGNPASWAADTGILFDTTQLGSPDIPASVLVSLSLNNGRDAAGSTADILATATSRSVELASPGAMSQLRRVCADVVLQSSAVSSQPTCTVSALDEAGNVLASKAVISTTTPDRQHIVLDVFAEVGSVRLKWDIDTNSQLITAAEIHDARVDFTPGQDRTN